MKQAPIAFLLALVLNGPVYAATPLGPQLQSPQPETSQPQTTQTQTPQGDPTVEFMTASPLSSAAMAEDSPFLGAEEGGTVSGVVEIRPNQDQLPGIRKVAYYLNGSKSGKVYQSPFTWGGPSGTGTAGFDTRTIADGDYTLSMTYTDSTGDHTLNLNFTVDNSGASTPPGETPETTSIPPSGRTLGGETFPAGTSFIDVEQNGNFSFLAAQNKIYIVNSSNPADPQVLSAVQFETQILDTLASPDGTGVFILEKGTLVNGQFRGKLWFVSTADPAHPVSSAKADVRDAARLMLYQDPARGARAIVLYPSSGENFIVDCAASGAGSCTVNFYNLYIHPDLVHIRENWILSTGPGMSQVFLNFNDVTATPTPAPVAFASGKENYFFVSLKNGTTAVYDVDQADTSATGDGILPVVNTIDPQGNDPIYSQITGNRLAILDSTGLIEIFDITNPLNVTRIDSVTVPGARRLDDDGTHLYAVTETEYRIIGPGETEPSPGGDPRVLGVTEGQTVSGTVNIRPNQEQIPGIRKVAYYLNGVKSGKVYRSPFLWGGSAGNGTTGFDTRTLPDGEYTLSMTYTDPTGDHTITVHFRVDN